jgi:hypothetical protein
VELISGRLKRKGVITVIRLRRNSFHFKGGVGAFVLCAGPNLLEYDGHWRNLSTYESFKEQIIIKVALPRTRFLNPLNAKGSKCKINKLNEGVFLINSQRG